jgi:hypothetical protein
MNRILTGSFLLIFVLSSCVPDTPTVSTPTPGDTAMPTATETSISTVPVLTAEELSAKLWVSDPTLPQYDPDSADYAAFPEVLKQLASMGPDAIDAADDLAVATRYPRLDSYLAAQTIIALGPEITTTLLPILIDNLKFQKPEVRIYSAILLGFAGQPASCSVGELGPHLWDADALVRTATALALERITGKELVESQFEINITPAFLADSVQGDTPEGKISGTARQWWSDQGSKVNWHPSYGLCDP